MIKAKDKVEKKQLYLQHDISFWLNREMQMRNHARLENDYTKSQNCITK